jgi:NAD(P)-dependent dehydrogenase (short-subunit alcohol dehydrogenase family)
MKDETRHQHSRRVALITGAAGTIGKAIATRIASRPEYEVVLLCRQSKQADRMLSVAFAGRLRDAGVMVNACHPGDVVFTLSRNLGFGGHEIPDQAASTPAWLATEAPGATVTGQYFEHQRAVSCRFGADRDAVEALYRVCEGYD